MEKKKKNIQLKLCVVCNKPVTKYNGFIRFEKNKRFHVHYECEKKLSVDSGFLNNIVI